MVAQAEFSLLLPLQAGALVARDFQHLAFKFTWWLSSRVIEAVSLLFTYCKIHQVLRMQLFSMLRVYESPGVCRFLWNHVPCLLLITREGVCFRSDALKHRL